MNRPTLPKVRLLIFPEMLVIAGTTATLTATVQGSPPTLVLAFAALTVTAGLVMVASAIRDLARDLAGGDDGH